MRFFLQTFFAAICAMVATSAWSETDEATAFFESRIRPVLVEHCYKCHSGGAKSPKGGLRLDNREALLRGGGKVGKTNGIDPATREALEKERRELEARVSKLATDREHAEFFTPAVPVAFAVHDSARPGGMRITIRGNAHALGDEVPRGFVRVVSRNRPVLIPSGESGRRQLADWIANHENPLTARRRESHLAEAVRRGDRPLGRLLRKSGRDAHPPGADRCPGAAIRRGRLVPQAPDPQPGVEPCLRHEQYARQPVGRGRS